jgi:hypothetical protein
VAARALDHRLRHVEADRAPRGAHCERREQGVDPRATTEVQHRLARREVRVAEGVADAQGQLHHAARKALDLLGGVEGLGHGGPIGAHLRVGLPDDRTCLVFGEVGHRF